MGEDLNVKMGAPFPRRIKPKRGETVVFSWIGFKSRGHRDRVNAKVMKETGDWRRCAIRRICPSTSSGGLTILVDACTGAA